MSSINCRGKLLDFEVPKIMGIINTTPDSFYDGGENNSVDAALRKAEEYINEGVDVLDVGGMSSRPGAEIIAYDEELSRVLPVIQKLHENFPDTIISIDTVNSMVAKEAINVGASLINDISAGTIDNQIFQVAIDLQIPYILMHIQGRPKNMQENPQYENVVLDILNDLKSKVYDLRQSGMKDIIIDPGFGFGKTVAHNYSLLKYLNTFKILDVPLMVGISRKSMICKVLGVNPSKALNGTSIAHLVALQNGADILRVHDVKEAVECVKIWGQLNDI